MNNIAIRIPPEEVFDHFIKNKERLIETMDVVACTDTDDFNRKSFLFVTNENDSLFLSLEAPEVIVNSETCTTKEQTICAVNNMLKELEELSK